MPRILVTGATGFIGRRLCLQLRALGHDVFETSHKEQRGAETLYMDLLNEGSIVAAIEEAQPEVVLHLASVGGPSDLDAHFYYEVNVFGTERLIKGIDSLGRRVRFIFVSSAGVYGNQNTDTLHEALLPRPLHHYGMSKFAAECVTLKAATKHDVTVVRPFSMIGAGMSDRFLVGKLLSHFSRRADSILLGNLEISRDYLDVDDLCERLTLLIPLKESYSEIVNMCSGTPVRLRDLFDTLQNLTGHKMKLDSLPELRRQNDIWKLVGSTEKLGRIFSSQQLPPTTGLAQSLTNALSQMKQT